MPVQLTDFAFLNHTENHLHISFTKPHQVLSSAVCNGGLVEANQLLNLKVPKHTDGAEPPEQTLTQYAQALNDRVNSTGRARSSDQGCLVGMMTAASMKSYRKVVRSAQGVEITVLATVGLANARRAGDTAEYRQVASEPEEIGTINLIMLTNARLTQAATVEALMVITEAKAAALQDGAVTSPISGEIATGTGTDSVAVVNGFGPDEVRYCGKHVLFGELLAQAVIEAISSAMDWQEG